MNRVPEHLQPQFGFNLAIGARLTRWGEGWCETELRVKEFHLNSAMIVHGGVHAAFLDFTCGMAGCFDGNAERRPCVTLNLNIAYIASTGGGVLRGKGRVTGGGRRIWFAEGEVTDGEGVVLARAQGTFRYVGEGAPPTAPAR